MTAMQGAWFQHPVFNRYWKHYVKSCNWSQHNLNTVSHAPCQTKASNFQSSTFDCLSVNSESTILVGSVCNVPRKKKQRRGFSRSRKRSSNQKKKGKRSQAKKSTSKSLSSDTFSFEMEITEQMVEFIKLSEDHRRNLKEERAKTNPYSVGEVEFIDCATATSWMKPQVRSVLPPQERQGLARSEELKRHYGKYAPAINAMETAIQLTFDRYCDLYQPKMWPVIPLKI